MVSVLLSEDVVDAVDEDDDADDDEDDDVPVVGPIPCGRFVISMTVSIVSLMSLISLLVMWELLPTSSML